MNQIPQGDLERIIENEMRLKLADYVLKKTSKIKQEKLNDYMGPRKRFSKTLFCIEPEFLTDFMVAFVKRIPLADILKIHPEAKNK